MFVAGISSSGVVNAKYEIPEFDSHTFIAASTPCAHAYIQFMRDTEAAIKSGDRSIMDSLNIADKDNVNETDFYYYLADSLLMI